MPIKMVVGLGNPGKTYVHTRHNVGYRVIDELEKNPPERLMLYKPDGVFMNESGRPVTEVMRRKGIQPDELLVVCDDFSILMGSIRLRTKGSSGGHNGLDSILKALATTEIARLRVGIGPVPEGMDPADFVLKRFAAMEDECISEMIHTAAEAIGCIAAEGWETAMNRFNRKAA